MKVYGKTKEEFQWPEDVDASLLALAANTGTTTITTAVNGYLHSFRQTNDEKDLATLSLTDRFVDKKIDDCIHRYIFFF